MQHEHKPSARPVEVPARAEETLVLVVEATSSANWDTRNEEVFTALLQRTDFTTH